MNGNEITHAMSIICPCGCKEEIILNLNPTLQIPTWTIEYNQGFPTIRPSIQRMIGCKSHFTITNGNVNLHQL